MIVALAGRRVDAVDSKESRFAPTKETGQVVRQRIRTLLETQSAIGLVSSASCGADLLALSEAGSLGLRRRVVLPYDRWKFRATSVTDRPGDWGFLYDKVLDEVEKSGDLLVIQPNSEDNAYAQTNHVIDDEARALGLQLHQAVTAVLVWDKKSRGEGDLTEEFANYARTKGIPIVDVPTTS